MKILHLGDLHLGKSIGDFDLIDDQKYMLDQILDILSEKQIDVVIMAGDIYDKSVPSEAATNLLDYFFDKIAELNIVAYVISGNHDSDDRLSYGRNAFKSRKINIYSVFDGTMQAHTLSDEFGDVSFYLLPFVKASQVRHFYQDAEISSYEDAVRTIIDNTEIDEKNRNIIIAHQYVAGKGEDPVKGGSEGLSVQNVGTIEKIGYSCFDLFDYAALGHIHSPQRVGRDEVRYAGSMLKYSLSEVDNHKSVPVITLGKKGDVKIELIPLIPMREMRHIKGKMAILLDKNNIENTNDFIYATLTDEDVINDAMGIFQQVYPNTIKIDYDNAHTRAIKETEIIASTENKSFSDLISEFYTMMYGHEMSEEEKALMETVAREAGVVHEAD